MRQLGTGTIDRSAARTTTSEYDAFGNQTKTTFADNTFISVAYDGFGRKKSETNQLASPALKSGIHHKETRDSSRAQPMAPTSLLLSVKMS